MNRILLISLFIVSLVLGACGQYGDLYAPPETVEHSLPTSTDPLESEVNPELQENED